MSGPVVAPRQTRFRDQDGGDNFQEEDIMMEVFSRRKLESNWDRYKESEVQQPEDDMPTQRGTDYHILLESAGDSFTQFRFSEEKDWEMDSFTASQMSPVFVDLQALAQTLQEVPLHQRLNLEAELVQVSTPVELPAMTLTPKQEIPKSSFAPSAKLQGLSTNGKVTVSLKPVSGSKAAEPPVDDGDEELDQLLSLQKPVSSDLENQSAADVVPQEACEETKVTPETKDEKTEKVNDVTPPKSASVRQEMTEEDLEDWLDSMIS
ncbi:cell death regulator Aven isoform X2 [Channa argus]|uniref:cell death regulator Aven isoform X2 n=1 Tax=Channa argus TaxID=215402 RepID=UPI003522D777